MAFASPQIRACPSAWVPNRVFTGFPNRKISEIRAANNWDSGLPHVHDSASSPNQVSRTLHARELETSQVSEFLYSRISCPWKTYFENAIRLRRFEGDVFSWIPQQLDRQCLKIWELHQLQGLGNFWWGNIMKEAWTPHTWVVLPSNANTKCWEMCEYLE
jgi:hypothetical protein